MTLVRRILQWIKWALRIAVFLVLLIFAINNMQDATVHWMFERQWHAPMTLIVLLAFALGLIVGALVMLPGLWRRRSKAAPAPTPVAAAFPATPPAPAPLEPPQGRNLASANNSLTTREF